MSENTQLTLVDVHKPPIPDGDYTLTVTQTYGSSDGEGEEKTSEKALAFSVLGERFALGPERVVGVFPPNRSSGDVVGCLPHVVLDRSTLPWERSAKGEGTVPWLAVVLVDANAEIDQRRTKASEACEALGFERESGQHPDDPVVLIDVPKEQIDRLLERSDEELSVASLLTHVRKGTADPTAGPSGAIAGGGGDVQEAAAEPGDRAVVLGDRLIGESESWTAHLVSLERYVESAKVEEKYTVVSLYRWSFHAGEHHPIGLILQNLDRSAATLGIDAASTPGVQPFVDAGYTLLPHGLRTGDRTASWYRGPLLPAGHDASVAPALPARSSDALLRFDDATGCLDASHAAAWELGRLIGLADGAYASALAVWKRAARHASAAAEAADRSPLHAAPTGLPPCPDVVRDRLASLAQLKDVPFTYLVPDERLLPPESVRFVTVDPSWIDALIDGALSLARVLRADRLRDEAHYEAGLYHPADGTPLVRSLFGVLVRSAAVRDVPDLVVQAYSEDVGVVVPNAGKAAELVRRVQLGPDVLLCLYDTDGDVPADVDVYPHPHGIHSGLISDAGEWHLARPVWRGEGLGVTVEVEDHHVDVLNLAEHLRTKGLDVNSATVGEALVQAVPRVRFDPSAVLPDPPSPVKGLWTILGVPKPFRDAFDKAGIEIAPLVDPKPPDWGAVQSTWKDLKTEGGDTLSSERLREWAAQAKGLNVGALHPTQVQVLAQALRSGGGAKEINKIEVALARLCRRWNRIANDMIK